MSICLKNTFGPQDIRIRSCPLLTILKQFSNHSQIFIRYAIQPKGEDGMEKICKLLRRVLLPPVWLAVLSGILGGGGLVLVFGNGRDEEWYAIPVYVLSAYALTVICIRLYRDGGNVFFSVKEKIHGVPFLHRFFTDPEFKLHTSLNLSLLLNCLYVLWKLFFGIRYRSGWFACLAAYYFLLALLRFSLLRYGQGYRENLVGQWKKYRLCGIALVPVVLTLSFEVLMIVSENQGAHYPGYLIYVMAMYAFYKISAAVRDLFRFRKYRSPVMSAAKAVGFAAALVSMLSLETAMLEQFGGTDSEVSKRAMTACTGAGVCAIISGMAVHMIYRATKELKRAQN